MTEITLVLPFALPPAELAPDLLRNLQLPALAAILSRSASSVALPFDAYNAALPHESYLAQVLGLSSTGRPAFAAAAMRGYGLEAGEGTWFLASPAHVQIARSHLTIADARSLQLSDSHSRTLFGLAKPYIEESGKTLVYGDAATWFLRADDWADLHTSSPDAAIGLNLTDWLPSGPRSVEYRKLQNEIQMLWFEHPVNNERESHSLPAINSFWPWAQSPGTATRANSPLLAVSGAPAWLAALASQPVPPVAELLAGAHSDATVLAAELLQDAINGTWAAWLQHMQRFEDSLFAPALQALEQGRIGRLHLVLGNRSGHTQITTSKMAQRAFWRRNTLDRLLP
ncbi:MAG: hypothetical protein V4723_05425 [Pseudomonadota bacterium]